MAGEGYPVDDTGPAFPTDSAGQVGNHTWHHEGITRREHFAGLAMQALASSVIGEGGPDFQAFAKSRGTSASACIASMSVEIAEALLVRLDRRGRHARIEAALRLVVAEFERLGIPEGAESAMLKQCREALE